MTAPLGSRSGYARQVVPVPSSTAPVPAMARNTALSVPDSPVSMLAAAPLVRVTPDHLALVRSLIIAGQTERALELLDAVWHPRLAEEQCWYLRLWILSAEGRTLEALELAREAAVEFPGSAAVAYLQAALEHAADSPGAAFEAARRAAAIATDDPLPAALLATLSPSPEADRPVGAGVVPHPAAQLPLPGNPVANPIAAAQLGAALLFPLGSGRALVPAPVSVPRRQVPPQEVHYDRRRFGTVAVATVLCALWAIRDPVPAALALGATVVLATRGWRS